MRVSGRMLATVLERLKKTAVAGISTAELARVAATHLKPLGGEPAFLGYQGFPDVLCVSVNDQVVHGIPGQNQLREGDIVGIDFGVRYRGMITDGAITVIIGRASTGVERLALAAEQALNIGIDKVKNGVKVGDVSEAIEHRLRRDNLGVVEALVGHGVGYHLHEGPEIPNYGVNGRGPILRTGMTIAIEPMATLGGKDIYIAKDGWTVKTNDGSLSAHFEHTVLVTERGAEILTRL